MLLIIVMLPNTLFAMTSDIVRRGKTSATAMASDIVRRGKTATTAMASDDVRCDKMAITAMASVAVHKVRHPPRQGTPPRPRLFLQPRQVQIGMCTVYGIISVLID
jgi:hypothetical protein